MNSSTEGDSERGKGSNADGVLYRMHDARYEATWTYKTAGEMIDKAEELGSTRFQIVTQDERYIQVNKKGDQWVREDGLPIERVRPRESQRPDMSGTAAGALAKGIALASAVDTAQRAVNTAAEAASSRHDLAANSITEGKERIKGPDADGVLERGLTSALEDLKSEIELAAASRDSNASARRQGSTILSRAELRQAAVIETAAAPRQGNGPQARIAGRTMPDSAHERGPAVFVIDGAVARHWADLDASEFTRMRSAAKKEVALEAIASNMRHSPEYTAELKLRSPLIAEAVSRVNEAFERVQAEREQLISQARAQEPLASQAAAREAAIDAEMLARVAEKRAQESREVAQALAADRERSEAALQTAQARRSDAASREEAMDADALVQLARRRAEDSRAAAQALGLQPQSRAAPAPGVHPVERSDGDVEQRTNAPRGPDGVATNLERLPNEGRQPTQRADAFGEPQREGPLKAAPAAATESRRPLKRPVLEEELSRDLLGRYVVSAEKSGLLDKGRTEFTFRGGTRDGLVAFHDAGKQLATKMDEPDVVRSMVEVAKTKGWNEVTVNGTDEFRRVAWLEARLNGLDVHGYEPREADKKRLAELQRDKAPVNTIAPNDRQPEKGTRETGTVDVEALRDRLIREMQSRHTLDREESSKTADARALGDTRAQAEVRADAELHTQRDVTALRKMGAKDLAEVARLVDGPASAETECKVRALLDGNTRHEPAHSAHPHQPGSKRNEHAGVHVDGDGLSRKECKVLEAASELLKVEGYGREFIDATLHEVENRMRRQRVHVGELIEHGAAHYKFDKDKDMSYFVKLRTPSGEETVWGVHLGQAIQKGGVHRGDQVVLVNTGKTSVTVDEKTTDAQGRTVWQKKDAELNAWTAQAIDRLTSVDRNELDERSRRGQPSLQVYDYRAERPVPARAQRTGEEREHSRSRPARDARGHAPER